MAKKKRSSGRRSQKVPVLATTGALVTGYSLYNSWDRAPSSSKVKDFMLNATGYDITLGKFVYPDRALATVAPAAMGIAGSMIASRLKANRYLSAVPFFKL